MTLELAREIREKSKNMKPIDIAVLYKVTPGTIWFILKNKTWKE